MCYHSSEVKRRKGPERHRESEREPASVYRAREQCTASSIDDLRRPFVRLPCRNSSNSSPSARYHLPSHSPPLREQRRSNATSFRASGTESRLPNPRAVLSASPSHPHVPTRADPGAQSAFVTELNPNKHMYRHSPPLLLPF